METDKFTAIDFDRRRNLQFDLLAIQDLETQMNGLPVGTIVQYLQQAGVNAIVAALWAGLKHEDPALTPAAVAQLLSRHVADGNSLIPIARGLSAALEASGVFRGAYESATIPKVSTRKRR
jgi:hypothetical protein